MINDKYTRDEKQIYFLNDKNIISSLDDETVKINPIPSQQIAVELCSKIYDLSSDLKNLDYDDSIKGQTGLIISSLSQKDGKIEYETRQLMSSDVSCLSEYVQNEITLSVNSLKCLDSIKGQTGLIISSLSQKDGKIEYETRQLSTNELCGIGDYAKTSDFNGKLGLSSLSDISGDFGNKVFITNPGTALSGVESDLSVVKIAIDDFNRKTANSELIDNVLYIVSSDYIEGYGRQLCNIVMNEDEDVEKSFLGMAATDKYVKSEINLSVGSLSCDDKLSTNAGFIISSLSQANGKIEYGIRQLSIDELGNTYGKLALSSLSDISSGFGNKVFITNPGTSLSGVESDLSVVKIVIDEFMRKSAYETLQNNTLYVVSSDYIEAYGQQISNVTMNNDDDPESSFLGMAATDSFVNCKLKDIKNHPDLSSFFGNDNGDIDLQQTVSVIKYILSSFGVR